MTMLHKEEKAVLGSLGKALQLIAVVTTVLICFIDPIRGRPIEWDWLQTAACIVSVMVIVFSVWLDKFLNAVREILEDL